MGYFKRKSFILSLTCFLLDCLFVYLFVCLFACLFACLLACFVCVFVSLFVYSFVCLFVCFALLPVGKTRLEKDCSLRPLPKTFIISKCVPASLAKR